jgi:hypothetical protein
MKRKKLLVCLAGVVGCSALAVGLSGCHPTRWAVAADYSNAYNWNRCATTGWSVDIGSGWYSGYGCSYSPGWYDCHSGWGRGWGHHWHDSGWSHSWGGGHGHGGHGRGCDD